MRTRTAQGHTGPLNTSVPAMAPRTTSSGIDHLTSSTSAHEQDMPPAFLRNVRMRIEVSSVRNAPCYDQLKEPSVLGSRAAVITKDACTAEGKQELVSTEGGVGNHGCGSKNLSLEVSMTESSRVGDACSRAIGQHRGQAAREADATKKALAEEVKSLRSALKLSQQRQETNFRALKDMCMQLHLAYDIMDSHRSDLSYAQVAN